MSAGTEAETLAEQIARLTLQLQLATAHGNDLFDQLNAALAVAHEAMGGELAEIQRRVTLKVATLKLERREQRLRPCSFGPA